MFITETSQLEAFIERALQAPVLAIDTEFLREKTYFAKLCLLQMATHEETVIVDPFQVKDLTILAPLFSAPTVTKLFHACRQDVEILYRCVGVMPAPLFDTQIAAALMGHTLQIGYGALVNAECDVQLKKTDSFTDWSRRPLSDSQIEYAADDVIYLPRIYDSMCERLQANGRLAWLQDDFADCVDPAKYEIDPRMRFRKLKRVSQLKPRQLSAAREVAAWRETRAAEVDIPRKWVITDEQVIEVCKREVRSLDSLFMVRGVKDKLNTADARTIVDLVVKGLDAPKETWPEASKRSRNEQNVDIPVDLLNCLVRLRAKQNHIAFQALASHDDLAAIARGHLDDTELLTGWRREIVGEELLDLMAGKIRLGIRDGRVKVYRCDTP